MMKKPKQKKKGSFGEFFPIKLKRDCAVGRILNSIKNYNHLQSIKTQEKLYTAFKQINPVFL
jgi:hypothetical protein